MFYIGIDGGGTKTEFVIANEKGNILGTHVDETIHHNQIGLENALLRVEKGINILLEMAQCNLEDVISIGMGIPGYGEVEKDTLAIIEIFKNKYGDKIFINNDVAMAYFGSFAFKDGVALVAGTGSMSYTMVKDKSFRSGGWGPDCGDEGSAYWVGVRVLNHYSKAAEGRIPKSSLYDLLKKELNLTKDFEIIDYVQKSKDKRRTIAALSSYAGMAATNGDEAAKEILFEGAKELSSIVYNTIKMTDHWKDEINVATIGGVFKAGDAIKTPLKELLTNLDSRIKLVEPLLKPSLGAMLYAKGKSDNNQSFIEALKK